MINIAWASRPAKHLKLPYYVNISQCPSRAQWASDLKCLTTSSRVYDFGRDCMISATECAMLQGIPACEVDFSMFSNAALFNATGSAMCAPCIGTIMLTVWLNPEAVWWKPK